MTNKTNKSGFALKLPWTAIFFLPALIGFTLIRYFQYEQVINPQNGFFVHDGGFLNHAYYAVFAVAAVIFLVLNIFDKRAKRGILGGKPAKAEFSLPFALIGGITALFCGGALILEFYNIAAAGETAQIGIIPVALTAIAALGATFAGYSFIAHRKLIPFVALAFLFMSANYAGVAALEFMARSYTANISARLVILSVSLLMAVFLLSAGRIIVRSETKFTIYTATLSGYLVAALILSDFTARLLYYFTATDELQVRLTDYAQTSGFEIPSPVFVAQGILVLWLLVALTIRGNQSEENNETDKLGELLKTEETSGETADGTDSNADFGGDDSVNPDELLS
jgi:hypothetical protein